MASKAKPRKWRRRLLLGIGIPALLLVTVLLWLLFFFPSSLVRRIAVSRAAEAGFVLDIAHLDINPIPGTVVVEGLSLDVPQNVDAGLTPIIQLGRYAVDADVGALLRSHRLHIEQLTIVEPRISLQRKDGAWNLDAVNAAVEALATSLGATPTPTPTPPPEDLRERMQAETDAMRQALAGLPVEVVVDRIDLQDAGFEMIDEGTTVASVQGVSGTSTFHLARDGSGSVEMHVDPDDEIAFVAVDEAATVRGRLRPDAALSLTLWDSGSFRGELRTVDTTVTVEGTAYDARLVAAAAGSLDAGTGRMTVESAVLDLGDYLHAGGTLDIRGLGAESIEGRYEARLQGDRAPEWLTTLARTTLEADAVHPGFEVQGTVQGHLTSTVPADLSAAVDAGEIPAEIELTAQGKTDAQLVSMAGIDLGDVGFDTKIGVHGPATSLQSKVHLGHVRAADLLGPQPLAVDVDNALTLTRFDDLSVDRFVVEVPSRAVKLAGGGHIDGFVAALNTYLGGADKGLDDTQSAIAAVEATRAVDLAGTLAFRSSRERELLPDVFASGGLMGSGRLQRGTSPKTDITAYVLYDDFSARVGTDVTVEGMRGRLDFSKAVLVGGDGVHVAPAQPDEEVAFVEKAMAEFDPAERGYYSRLAPYRRNRENLKVRLIQAGAYRIEDLIADVTYDGEAMRASYLRMNVLGGETVGRAYVRPEPGGIRIAYFADFAGIDIAPILREKPPESADDATRVNGSSAASTFIPTGDPLAGIAQATARLDFTAAGSRVVEEILVFLDPEQADPVFNWARNVNQNVKGLSRPELNVVLNRGFYDVTIAFPSMGLSKDVRRVPLGQTLALKFSRGLLEDLLPPPELLELASARGIDRNGEWIVPAAAP